LAVDSGANVAPGQIVTVSAKLAQEALAREVSAACSDRGAHHVSANYSDPWVSRARFERAPEETLGTVISWVRERSPHQALLGQTYGRFAGGFDVTEDLTERLVCLPLWSAMEEADTEHVLDTLRHVLSRSHPTVRR
jgi:dTDP-4-amino-4,6-dideoxygalactose transaminase